MTKVITGAGIALDEIGVGEVHEAFAAQALRALRELSAQLEGLEVPDDRLNLNGGAVAVGHPFGASGTATCSLLPSLSGSKPRATGFWASRSRGRVWPSCSRTTRREPGSAFDASRRERGSVQVALTEPEDLKAQ